MICSQQNSKDKPGKRKELAGLFLLRLAPARGTAQEQGGEMLLPSRCRVLPAACCLLGRAVGQIGAGSAPLPGLAPLEPVKEETQ